MASCCLQKRVQPTGRIFTALWGPCSHSRDSWALGSSQEGHSFQSPVSILLYLWGMWRVPVWSSLRLMGFWGIPCLIFRVFLLLFHDRLSIRTCQYIKNMLFQQLLIFSRIFSLRWTMTLETRNPREFETASIGSEWEQKGALQWGSEWTWMCRLDKNYFDLSESAFCFFALNAEFSLAKG